jgi:hypothetical protein
LFARYAPKAVNATVIGLDYLPFFAANSMVGKDRRLPRDPPHGQLLASPCCVRTLLYFLNFPRIRQLEAETVSDTGSDAAGLTREMLVQSRPVVVKSRAMSALLSCLAAAERSHAEGWLGSFAAEPDRNRIIGDNWAKEANFSDRIAVLVGAALLNLWHPGDPPVPAIAAITPLGDFCAPETTVADPGTALSRVMTLHAFAKFHLDASMPLTKDLTDAELLALLGDLDGRPSRSLTGCL